MLMKMSLSLFLLLVWISYSASSLHAENSTRPNIVLILSDDQAWTDYGFMGHPDVRTPHLDRLAMRSLVFERGYVAAPLCRPSLASMLTGQYPRTHGAVGNDVDGTKDRQRLDEPVRERFHQLPSFVRLLTANGYLAHQSGKWWEGSHADGGFTHGMMPHPARHGSSESLSIGRQGMKPVTDFIDHAIADEKPFFVWYAPFMPHTPHTPPDRVLEKYKVQTPDGLPGVNLLDEQARQGRDAVFGETHSIHNMTLDDPDDTLQYLWCVEDKWKLIVRHHGKDTTAYSRVHRWDTALTRLYRIQEDPHESHDLAAQHPEIVERLRQKISAWHAQVPLVQPLKK